MQSGEARFGLEVDGEKLWRHQVFGARMREKNGRKLPFFSRDSESAFGSESAIRRGSFWTRIRWGKAVAAPGVRGQDAREKWKKTSFFFLAIQRARLAEKVQSGGARFGLELDGEKLWRHQVFGARMREKNGSRWGKAVAAPGVRGQDAREKWKKTFFLGIQRARLASKVQSGEARFGLELDGEKLWRHQRARLASKVQSGEARFGLEVDGEKLWRQGQDAREKWTKTSFFF